MTNSAAIKKLLREVEFLGFNNIGELVEDISQNPGPYPLSVLEAYRVYKASY